MRLALPKNRTLVAGTTNKNKCAELQTVASEFGISIISLAEHQSRTGKPPPPQVEETAGTYTGNARLKAEAYCRWAEHPVIADDSGLEVRALGNEPGVESANYLRPGASYAERMAQIVSELQQIEKECGSVDRSAAFVCYLVLALPGGETLEASAELPGVILEEPRGEGGFGYDPIVYIPEIGATLAEIDFATTCKVGFRAKAAHELFNLLFSSSSL